MIGWLDDVLGVASTILSAGMAGPLGVPAGAGLGALAQKLHQKEQQEAQERSAMVADWVAYAEELEKDQSLSNPERDQKLTGRIRMVLMVKAQGKPPKERQVRMYADLAVASINGDFQEKEGG